MMLYLTEYQMLNINLPWEDLCEEYSTQGEQKHFAWRYSGVSNIDSYVTNNAKA